MAEDTEFSPEQMVALSEFQNLTGIDDMERCRSILESHDWNLEAAAQVILNMREDTAAVSDAAKDEELSPEKIVALSEFQGITGIDDTERCQSILKSQKWNLEEAVLVSLNMREDTPELSNMAGGELSAEQIIALSEFQDVTGIDDTERCRNVLESHNWNLEEAIRVTLNVSEGSTSDSDIAEDVELSSEQLAKVMQFQEVAGIDDRDRCRNVLQSHNWNLDGAIEVALSMPEGPPPVSDTAEEGELSPEQIVTLAEFQEVTAIDDTEKCRNILQSRNWNLEEATEVALNMPELTNFEQELNERSEMEEMDKIPEERERKEETLRKKMELIDMVKEEPPPDSPRTILIIIQLANGKRVDRRFSKDDSLKALYYFVFCHPESPSNFKIVTEFPERDVPCEPSEDVPEPPTFEAFGLSDLETVFVHNMEARM